MRLWKRPSARVLVLFRRSGGDGAQDKRRLFIISSNLHFISANWSGTGLVGAHGETQFTEHMFRIFTAKTLTISAIRRDFLITLSNANDAEDKLINPENDTFGSTSAWRTK